MFCNLFVDAETISSRKVSKLSRRNVLKMLSESTVATPLKVKNFLEPAMFCLLDVII